MSADVIALPWSGEYWPGRIEDGLPTFRFRQAPTELVTRRQLRSRGLCPGGQSYVAQLKWRGGSRWAGLYRLDLAKPSPGATTAQLMSLRKACRVLRTCAACGHLAPYRVPRSNGRRCWPCEQMNTRPGGHSAKNAHRAGAPNTHESGEIPMVGTCARPGQAAYAASTGAGVRL